MELEPQNQIDGDLLFIPRFYDHKEAQFIQSRLRPGNTFVDLGAYIGAYTLFAAKIVGPGGCVISVEADPLNFEHLVSNIQLNAYNNIKAIHCGLSDHTGLETFAPHVTNNPGGLSFLPLTQDDGRQTIQCRPLGDIIRETGVEKIDGMKIDIEGYDYRVLKRFFAEADKSVHPRFIIAEECSRLAMAGGDVIELLESRGYREIDTNGLNHIMEKA
jgi:FkbM family methyltransferase